jgi:hypothetical protein
VAGTAICAGAAEAHVVNQDNDHIGRPLRRAQRFDGWEFSLARVQRHFALGRNVGDGQDLSSGYFWFLCHFYSPFECL